jgi:regulator of sigma E protease
MGLQTAIIFFIVLGILVFVHELGHFLAAKMVGVAVEEFAFGFGPRLVTLFRRSGTEYTIHALPLGGFVNLVGMQPEEVHLQNGLMSKPAWARAFVFLAGPLMNFVLALAVLCSMGVLTGLPIGQSNQVMQVYPGTEAARVQLQTGDRIVALDGRPVESGDALIEAIGAHAGKDVTLTVERNGATIQIPAKPTPEIYVSSRLMVAEITPGSRASRAGLKAGDQLVAANGKRIRTGAELDETSDGKGKSAPMQLTVRRGNQELTLQVEGGLDGLTPTWEASPLAATLGLKPGDRIEQVNGKKLSSRVEVAAALRASAGRPVRLTVLRDYKPVPLRPQEVPVALADEDQIRVVGKMGFLPAYRFRKMSLQESVMRGWEAFLGFFVGLASMVSSGQFGKNAGSVGTIYRAVDMYSKLGLGPMLNLVASLSLSLAVFNLLPIPVLDGGHLGLLAVEVVRRRRLNPNEYRIATAIGFTVVLVAFVLLMYMDVMKWRAGTPLINL